MSSSSSSAAAASSPSPSSPNKPKQLSKTEFVEYFTLLRQSNPSLTAQEFFAIVHNDHEAAQKQHQAASAAAAAVSTPAQPVATASIVPDATTTPVVTPPAVEATSEVADSAAASSSSTATPASSPMMVNNLRHSKLFAPPATEAVVVPPTTAPESSQASSSTITPTDASASPVASITAPDTTTPVPPATSPPTINIANLKDEIDKERERLKEYMHQQSLLRYQKFKQEAEENARLREENENNNMPRARPLAMAQQRGAAAPNAPAAAAGAPPAVPAAARRGIPERIGDGLRFLGQMDLFDMLLRYGLFALLISNGSWHVFFIIVACLCGYSVISYLLSLIEFRRGQAPQADPAAAAAPPTRQRRPQDCSTAFRVWYICFKLFLLFFVSFLPWFKVEGLRRELHYEGVLYYPEDHLAAENPPAPAADDAPAPQEEEPQPAPAAEGEEEAIAAQ